MQGEAKIKKHLLNFFKMEQSHRITKEILKSALVRELAMEGEDVTILSFDVAGEIFLPSSSIYITQEKYAQFRYIS